MTGVWISEHNWEWLDEENTLNELFMRVTEVDGCQCRRQRPSGAARHLVGSWIRVQFYARIWLRGVDSVEWDTCSRLAVGYISRLASRGWQHAVSRSRLLPALSPLVSLAAAAPNTPPSQPTSSFVCRVTKLPIRDHVSDGGMFSPPRWRSCQHPLRSAPGTKHAPSASIRPSGCFVLCRQRVRVRLTAESDEYFSVFFGQAKVFIHSAQWIWSKIDTYFVDSLCAGRLSAFPSYCLPKVPCLPNISQELT